MAQITTNAIVLRRADYRENDRMLTLFSPTLGRIDALARGCRRQKSPLMAASEVFCAGEYVLYAAGDRMTVVSCAVQDTFYPLRSDFDRLAHGMYALELCAAAVQPEQENERLFLLLLRSLAHLAYSGTDARRVTAVFLMGFVSLLGFRPQVGRCAGCGAPVAPEAPVGSAPDAPVAAFSPERGGVLCGACGAGEHCRLSAAEVGALQAIMRRGIKTLDEEAEISDALFQALRQMAESRVDAPIRSGKML